MAAGATGTATCELGFLFFSFRCGAYDVVVVFFKMLDKYSRSTVSYGHAGAVCLRAEFPLVLVSACVFIVRFSSKRELCLFLSLWSV